MSLVKFLDTLHTYELSHLKRTENMFYFFGVQFVHDLQLA